MNRDLIQIIYNLINANNNNNNENKYNIPRCIPHCCSSANANPIELRLSLRPMHRSTQAPIDGIYTIMRINVDIVFGEVGFG